MKKKVQPEGKAIKKKKSILKKWWFWFIIVLLFLVAVMSLGGSEETSKEVVTLEEVGGFAQWKANGFEEVVRTDIIVQLPVVPKEVNNYAVTLGPLGTDVIVIMQEDESPANTWDWLMNAQPFIDGEDEAYFKATLAYTGITTEGEKKYPVFIISDTEPYVTSVDQSTENTVTEIPLTETPVVTQEPISTTEPEETLVTYSFVGQSGDYYYLPEGTAGDGEFCVKISNITDSTFDFAIYENGNLIFKHHTAEITGEYTGTYYGQQYTLDFFWSQPGVIEVYGFDTVAGMEFVNMEYLGVG